MDLTRNDGSMGFSKRFPGSYGSLGSLGECFSKTRKIGATVLGLIGPSRDFKEAARLMQLPTAPMKVAMNQMTNYISYRDGISGSTPQVHCLFFSCMFYLCNTCLILFISVLTL